MIYKLTYESNASAPFDQLGVEQILSAARTRNKAMDITGCLVYHNGCFVQILEGDRSHVTKVFKRIAQDTRHSNVRLVCEEVDDKRSFSDWNMAYFDPTMQGIDTSDLQNFERNLLMLSDFSDKLSATVNLFWFNVRKAILNLKIV
ncbi:BLUF domain-containing protein [Pseudozobellia thermophila]|uniref:Sensors of blue-light using FAD n=1 Tax=Pseudozobellia thermophila TaxID=192903 RepID=A0A1M6M9N4_9FLAO|nr:BLUF domain-containing protein [Pseudozobellia thermophila]SHJ80151.1 Sensors of blue-light using FAD [Pseudozobellia thermophila]